MILSIRRSLAWMTLSQGSLLVMQFGASLIIARLLTPREMGVFAIAYAIVGLLSIIRALGLSNYIMRATELNSAVLSAAFTINAAIAVFLAAMIVGLSTLGAAFLSEPGVQRALLAMAVLPLISIFELLPAAGIERRGNFRAIALVNLTRTLLANALMLGLAYKGFSYMSLVYGQIGGTIMATVAINIVGRRHVSFRLGFIGWRDIARYGLQMLAISGVTTAALRMSELLLGRILGLDMLGIYSRASGLNGLLWDNVHLIIARIVFVDFAEQRRQGKSLRASYLRIMQMATGMLWPAFAGLAIIAGPLVLTLYGETWVAAALPLSLLSVSAMVAVSVTMTWEVFVVSQETAQQARIEFVRAGVGVGLFAGGCLISLAGAAAARIADTAFAVMLYRGHLERMTDTRFSDYVPIYLEGALLTVLATAPALLIMAFYGWSPQAPVPVVLAAIVVGVIGWLIGLRVMRHPLCTEFTLILARLRPRPVIRTG